ncbi:bud emergence protein 1 [Entophlyctis luteolus]|nr:bud emergence protein 1 [Entophlyctis luteolus]
MDLNRPGIDLRLRSMSLGAVNASGISSDGSRAGTDSSAAAAAAAVAMRQQLQLQQLQTHQQRMRNPQQATQQPNQATTQSSMTAKALRPSSPPRYRALVPAATSAPAAAAQAQLTIERPLPALPSNDVPSSVLSESAPVVLSMYETDAVYGGSVTGRERLDQLDDNRDSTLGKNVHKADGTDHVQGVSVTSRKLESDRSFGSREAGDDVYGPRGLRQRRSSEGQLSGRLNGSTLTRNNEDALQKELPPISTPTVEYESPTQRRNFPSIPDIRAAMTRSPVPKLSSMRYNMAAMNVFKNIPNPFSPQSPTSPRMGQPLKRSLSQPNVDSLKKPPMKIVKAAVSHTAVNFNELSYQVGDFFYVLRENPTFYEVSNPLTQVVGFVAKSHFVSLEKSAQTFSDNDAIFGGPKHGFAEQADLNLSPPLRTYSEMSSKERPSRSRSEKVLNHELSAATSVRAGNVTSPLANEAKPDFTPPKRGVSRSRERTNRSNNDLRQNAPKSPDYPLPQVQHQSPQMLSLPSKIKYLRIQSHLLFPSDPHYYYKIEFAFERPGNVRNTIYRTHEDFWSLQVSLLSFFPAESGRQKGSQRLIPFLPLLPQGGTVSGEEAVHLQKRFECYLRELLHSPLPVISSGAVARFFTLRNFAGVVADVANIADDVEDMPAVSVLSMLNDYDDEHVVKIKLAPANTSILEIEFLRDSGFQELLDIVAIRLGKPVQGLTYKDELGMFLSLVGDRDLKLLMETFADDVIFFPI